MAIKTHHGTADYHEVNGLRLDGSAWYCKRAPLPRTPAIRTVSVTMPGRPGRVFVPSRDVHSPAEIELVVGVRDVNPVTGSYPSGLVARRAQFEKNMQSVLAAFGTAGKAVRYRYVDPAGAAWFADGVVIAQSAGEVKPGSLQAEMRFVLELPGVYLRSETVTTTSVPAGTNVLVTNLAGGTAPIVDAKFTVVSGTDPAITSGGNTLSLVGAASTWVADAGAMTSVNGGAAAMHKTKFGTGNLLTLQPSLNADGVVEYRVTTTHTTTIEARKARFA